MSPSSHRQLAAARKYLSDARLTAFFRAVHTEWRPISLKIINRELDKGRTLDAFFAEFGNLPGKRSGLEVRLAVKRISPHVYLVAYGLAGGHVGDGGEWRVVFSAGAKVLRVRACAMWMA